MKPESEAIYHEFGHLQILQLAVLQDNYSYLVHDTISGATVAIDPAADEKIVRQLAKRNWALQAIWNTHWHTDHCGGNSELLAYAQAQNSKKNIEVLAYSAQHIPSCTREICSGETLALGTTGTLGSHAEFQVHESFGHTLDHVVFTCQLQDGNSLAFCGDTLFSLGCGRLFEGTAKQMLQSLDFLASLPAQTLLFCGHEYTRANLRFALWLEEQNPVLQSFAQTLTDDNISPTVPSTLAFELTANPFLRLRDKDFSMAMVKHCSNQLSAQLPTWSADQWHTWSAEERFAQLRTLKDSFS